MSPYQSSPELHFSSELTSPLNPAQTDLQDPSADASADDFLAREKAILGEDAEVFATAEDGVAFNGGGGDDDLLGGGDGETAQFEQQFPDLSGPNEVRFQPDTHNTICITTHHHVSNILRFHRQSLRAATSLRPGLP